MDKEPTILEKEAYLFLSEEKLEQAFRLFKKAAEIYKSRGNHKQSALCFTSAASCWAKKSGENTFYNAALSYEEAARQAIKAGDFEYASLLYKHAAINHERDGEFINFSYCYYISKECYRKFLTYFLINPRKISPITDGKEKRDIKTVIRRIFLCFTLTFSFIIWGHGERPTRTFITALLVILFSAFIYTFGNFFGYGVEFRPDLLKAFYFSVVTFTTLGYGDITPIGFNKLIAIFEAFSALFIMPLFLVGLTRKYLRF
ncbi:MAG: ion channel [Candidatus Omnitrophota bacterium]